MRVPIPNIHRPRNTVAFDFLFRRQGEHTQSGQRCAQREHLSDRRRSGWERQEQGQYLRPQGQARRVRAEGRGFRGTGPTFFVHAGTHPNPAQHPRKQRANDARHLSRTLRVRAPQGSPNAGTRTASDRAMTDAIQTRPGEVVAGSALHRNLPPAPTPTTLPSHR